MVPYSRLDCMLLRALSALSVTMFQTVFGADLVMISVKILKIIYFVTRAQYLNMHID